MLLALTVFSSQVYALALDTDSDEYLGWIDDGIPANPTNEADWINILITLDPYEVDNTTTTETITHSGNVFGDLPLADYLDTYKVEDGSNVIDPNPGWDYLLGKYGNVGSLVWYIAGITEEITIPLKWGQKPLGLSHYSLYNSNPGTPVPEPATMVLLGLGLIGIAGLGRKTKK